MTRLIPLSTTFALPVVLTLAGGASADVTAGQVYSDWKGYMQGLGYTVTATETAQGDDIVVSDLLVSVPLADDAAPFVISTGPLTFAQNGAEVQIVLPDSLPITLETTPEGTAKDPWKMRFTLEQSGHSNTVSGTPEKMTYETAADTFALTLLELVTDGDSFGPENAKINFAGTDLRSTTVMSTDTVRNYTQQVGLATMTYDIYAHNPNEDVKVIFKGGTSDLRFDGTSDIPTSVNDTTDMAAMLAAGFAAAGSFSYGAGTMELDVDQPTEGDMAAKTSSDGGRLAFNVGQQALGYEAVQDNLQMTVNSAELPFPVNFSMAQTGFNLAMPVSPSDDPQDFAFGLNFSQFVMADLLWSIFDPAGQLPRDPATLQMDMTGKAKMLINWMDPDAAASAAAANPGELHALTIKNVLLEAAGAKLEGAGDLTFDNTDTATYAGMPKPVGAVNVALAGANALMDKLVAMGLLPEQQAMGARMMMGLFAVPGDGPDTLKSTIEFNEAGQILANGQRIK